jgi:hypothetical protein
MALFILIALLLIAVTGIATTFLRAIRMTDIPTM